MRGDLKLICLVPVFGAVGAAATGAMWGVFDQFLMEVTPAPYTVLGCILCGLIGPIIVGGIMWFATRNARFLRWPAFLGLGMVLATELAFYVPLGFFAVAYHQAPL